MVLNGSTKYTSRINTVQKTTAAHRWGLRVISLRKNDTFAEARLSGWISCANASEKKAILFEIDGENSMTRWL